MTAKLWRVADGKEIFTLRGHYGQVYTACFSPDEKLILTASSDGTFKIWRSNDGKLLQDVKAHKDEVYSAIFSPDQKYILTASADRTLKLWDTNTGSLVRTFSGHSDKVLFAQFKDDGQYFFSRSLDKNLRVWKTDLDTATSIIGDSGDNTYFSFEENSVISISRQGEALIYPKWNGSQPIDSNTNYESRFSQISTILKANKPNIIDSEYLFKSIDFFQDGKYVLYKVQDTAINVFESSSGKEVNYLKGDLDWIKSFNFSFAKNLVLLADNEKKAIIYSLDKKINYELSDHRNWIRFSRFSANGEFVALASYDGSVILYKTSTGEKLITFKSSLNSLPITSASFSADNKSILLTNTEGAVKLINKNTGIIIQKYEGHSKYITSSSFSKSGRLIVASSLDSSSSVWETNSGKSIYSFRHNNIIYCSKFSHNEKYVATASFDSTIIIWDLSTGKKLKTLIGHEGYVYHCSFSLNDKYLASASYDSTAIIWDLQSGKIIHRLEGHTNTVNNLSISNDEKWMATGSSDSTVKLWDFQTGKLIKTFEDKTDWVEVVRFSPDNKTLAIGSDDGLIKFWDIATGKIKYTFKEHSGWIWDIEYSNDGKYIITTGADSKLIVRKTDNDSAFISLIDIKNDDWIAFDQDYRYDGSKNAINSIYFICGTETINLKQIKTELHVPHLLEIINSDLNLNDLKYKKISDLDLCNGVPIVESIYIDSKKYLAINIIERGLPFNAAEIFVNNLFQLVIPKSEFKNDLNVYSALIPLDKLSFISGIKNTISARAISNNNVTSGIVSTIWNQAGKMINPEEIKVFAIIIGVGDYIGENNPLNTGVRYAENDAKYIEDVIKLAAGKILINPSKQLKLYHFNTIDSDNPNIQKPYLANIQKAIDSISIKSSESDLIIFYFAGHGVVNQGSFKMLTAECFNKDCQQGISAENLINWLSSNKIKAQKRVFILDACNSGKAFSDLVAIRGDDDIVLKSKMEKELILLGEYAGMIGIAAAPDGKSANEYSILQHGLLTYSLLNTIKEGSAITDGNRITFKNWFEATKKEMAFLSGLFFNTDQTAQIFTSNDSDFLFGKVERSVRESINIPVVEKKIISKIEFVGESNNIDYLSLTNKIIHEKLNTLINEGYIYNKNYLEGISIEGSYRFLADKISISSRVIYKNNIFYLNDEVESITKLDQLLENLINQVMHLLLNTK